MKRRIGILTAGGDCPGLNAAIRGVARAAYETFDETEIVGFHDGEAGRSGVARWCALCVGMGRAGVDDR